MSRFVGLNAALLSDPAFEVLSPAAQRAWFLLRLDTRVGLTAIGRLSVRAAAKVLSTTEQETAAILAELATAAGGVGVDHDAAAGLLWFRGAFRQEPNSWQVRKGASSELARLPLSPLVVAWIARYRDRFVVENPTDSDRKALAEIDAVLLANERTGYRIDTVSNGIDTSLARAPEPDPDPDPDPEPEKDNESAGASPLAFGIADGVALWAKNCPNLPQPSKVTTKRTAAWRARCAEAGFIENFEAVCQRIAASPFCRGENARGWQADFDFAIRPETWVKTLEGKYDPRPRAVPQRPDTPSGIDPGAREAHAEQASTVPALSPDECESAARDAEAFAERCEASGRTEDARRYRDTAARWREAIPKGAMA